jgi:hypothetical protein
MESFAEGAFVQPDTGSLRSDLLAFARTFQARASSLVGQGLFRTMGLESTDLELQEIGKTFRVGHETTVAGILDKARARGEIDRPVDHRLVTMLVIGPLHLRLFVSNEAVDEAFIGRLVDMILSGLSPRGAVERRYRVR